uniref:Uncharacterized protein n=1 Tax=Candidatus Kentrum eta TaxID=2126337 RepID=A0A450UFE3_9GAMM|nr:MAG: hypothetical protein BECKH772A_GA0070896_1001711 [Candidatus Kentron sp. H]VFJ91275.1 MAG: hypothetical protein BECKH772B_GA0070898_1001611 [Candidatus Kentron sp. H]VFJ97814.1 MAG: hypothetical protein BECKH772C_GA0070978_1001611 [Candidatus Kentron sp. H]
MGRHEGPNKQFIPPNRGLEAYKPNAAKQNQRPAGYRRSHFGEGIDGRGGTDVRVGLESGGHSLSKLEDFHLCWRKSRYFCNSGVVGRKSFFVYFVDALFQLRPGAIRNGPSLYRYMSFHIYYPPYLFRSGYDQFCHRPSFVYCGQDYRPQSSCMKQGIFNLFLSPNNTIRRKHGLVCNRSNRIYSKPSLVSYRPCFVCYKPDDARRVPGQDAWDPSRSAAERLLVSYRQCFEENDEEILVDLLGSGCVGLGNISECGRYVHGNRGLG